MTARLAHQPCSANRKPTKNFAMCTRKSLRTFGDVVDLGEQLGRHAALPFVAHDGIAAAEAVECFPA
jgi:hypothetical protein